MEISVFIIASGSGSIGTGHLSRQLEVASSAKLKGLNVFLMGHLSSAWLERFSSLGVRCIVSREFPTSDEVLRQALSLSLNPKLTWIIRDNYGLNPSFNLDISQEYPHLAEFDDVPKSGRIYEILVNPGLSREQYSPEEDQILNTGTAILGAKAAIVGSELRELRTHRNNLTSNGAFKGLVSFGYSDPTDASSLFWGCPLSSFTPSWEYLLGPDYSGSLKTGMAAKQKKTFALEGPLREEYFSYQLGIGAGGVSSYERAFCGIPSINFALIENQMGAAILLEENQAALCLSTFESESVNSAVERLMDVSAWGSFRDAGMDLVDGLGAERLLTELLERIR